jgi:CRP-like cAMP-binding protein
MLNARAIGSGNGASAFDAVRASSASEYKAPRIQWTPAYQEHAARVVSLPRGGTVIKTAAGNVQVGMPPETIKDSMIMGLDVSQYFVIPRRLFDRRAGINVAEFEFPAYYNFFLKGQRKTTLITTKEVETRIREVFRETLLGPENFDAFDADFSSAFPVGDRPDPYKECRHFGMNPFDRTKAMSVDTLLAFIHFDEHGLAVIPSADAAVAPVHVQVSANGADFVFIESGVGIAAVPTLVELPPTPPVEVRDVFSPPRFGVTMLGCSSGFDPVGSTTGFVIWINGRGLMVDPPPHSSHVLAREGIPARLIDGVIVTHCHADHDAGTFQKILQEKRIMVMTTATVCNSFLRKYSALSDLPIDFLRSMFEFRAAVVGEPLTWHGAHIRFFYAFHSIPCVGFECSYGGKSFVYSADTFFDPAALGKLVDEGVLSSGRGRRLIEFPFAAHDLILHEAGIPPIHTPPAVLQRLPAEQLAKLYLVHITAQAVPAGMRRFEAGVAHTVQLPIADADAPAHASAVEVLDLVGNIELFRTLTIEQAREVLICARRRTCRAGTIIVSAAGRGALAEDASFSIISRGMARVQSGPLIKRYTVGDFFGEDALLLGASAVVAEVVAETDVELLTLNREHFLYLLNTRADIIGRLRHLLEMRALPSWEALQRNSLLKELSSAQKTDLQSMMSVRTLGKGQHLWRFNESGHASEAVLVLSAELQLINAETHSVSRLAFGSLIAEARAMATRGAADAASDRSRALFFPQAFSILDHDIGRPHKTELVCVGAGDVLVIPAPAFVEFLKRTPKLFLMLLDAHVLAADSTGMF